MKKRIEVRHYKLYNKGVGEKDFKIILISDIHFSSITNLKHLYWLKEKINCLHPDYICIAGDIIDCLNFVRDYDLMENFYNWLHNLGNIYNKKIPVLISIGNHDTAYKYKKGESSLIDNKDYKKFLNELKSSNVYVLDNFSYEDEYVFITGFTQPPDSFHSIHSLKIETDYYNKLNKLLNPSNKKFKIALIHSPINLTDKHIAYKLRNYDLILSGHMHNGMIPPFADKILKGNSGLIEPNKKLFPKLARGSIKLDKDRFLIISGGITKLSWTTGIFHYGNFIYPMHIESILVTKDI